MTSSDTVRAAVDLINRGLAVTPLPPGARRPEPGWLARATRDPAVVEAWPVAANVGVACRPSGRHGLVVLDLDRHAGLDGLARLAQLRAAADAPPSPTFAVATPSGGRHLYYEVPAAVVVLSVSGDRSPLGAGIDVRGPGRRCGGYVLGPGSVTAAGRYEVASDAPVRALPGWLAELLAVPVRYPASEVC